MTALSEEAVEALKANLQGGEDWQEQEDPFMRGFVLGYTSAYTSALAIVEAIEHEQGVADAEYASYTTEEDA